MFPLILGNFLLLHSNNLCCKTEQSRIIGVPFDTAVSYRPGTLRCFSCGRHNGYPLHFPISKLSLIKPSCIFLFCPGLPSTICHGSRAYQSIAPYPSTTPMPISLNQPSLTFPALLQAPASVPAPSAPPPPAKRPSAASTPGAV